MPVTPGYESLSHKTIAAQLRRNLPLDLRSQKAFLLWKFAPPKKSGGKKNKIPYYANGSIRHGDQGSPRDIKQLATFAEALKVFESSSKYSGVGVCAVKPNNVFFVDLDNCIDTTTGELNDVATELLRWVTYTELSPSGKGLRMVLGGNPQFNGKNNSAGVEVFSTTGFVTFTGTPFGDRHRTRIATTTKIARLKELVGKKHDLPIPVEDDDPLSLGNIPNPLTPERYIDAKRAINHIDPDCDYDTWITVGQALHSGDRGATGKGFELWLRWSRKGQKFDNTDESEMAHKWEGFKSGKGVTLSSLFALAQQGGFNASKSSPPEPIPEDTKLSFYKPSTVPEVITNPLADGLFDNHGAYVFIGRAKIGKSRILGSIVAAAVTGTKSLGFQFNRKCKVLALTLEEDPATLLNRIRAYGVEPTEYESGLSIIDDKLAVEAAKKYSGEHDWTAWLDKMLKQIKPDLVYVDTAIKMRMVWQNDPAYRTKNITEQDYQNASWLDEAAQKHKCVIISVIHGSKRKSIPQYNFDPFESIGTTSWTLAGCTGALVLMDKPGSNAMEDEDDGQRVFSVRGRYMPHGDKHYTLQSNDNGTFSNLGEYQLVQASIRTMEYLRAVLDIQQRTNMDVPARNVAAECGVKERTVRVLLHRFAESGELYEGMRLVGVTGSGYRLLLSKQKRDKGGGEKARKNIDDLLA